MATPLEEFLKKYGEFSASLGDDNLKQLIAELRDVQARRLRTH